MDVRRVLAHVDPRNHASLNALASAGFVIRGQVVVECHLGRRSVRWLAGETTLPKRCGSACGNLTRG